MKPLFSEEYYRKQWDKYDKPRYGHDPDYLTMEEDLQATLKYYRDAGIAEKAIAVIEKQEVEKIIEKTKKHLIERMRMIEDVEAGRSNYGYTDKKQAIRHAGDTRKRFEFNCLKLSDFIKKHQQ